LSEIKFGTDGWRAIMDKEFTFDNVKIVAQAVADYVNDLTDKDELRNKELIVGYDSRRDSENYADTVSSVLAANKIKVILTDRITTTPAVSYAIKRKNLTGGVMVTASHNPPSYNGIKYKAFYSGSADPGIIEKIEAHLGKTPVKEMPLAEAAKKGLLTKENVIPDQLAFVEGYVDMELIKNSGLKIVIDSMHGAAGRYMEEMLSPGESSVVTLHADRDVTFGGVNPEPIEKYLSRLIEFMKTGEHDIAIALDGDVDRVGAVAKGGRFLNAQYIMALLLWHFVEDRKMKGSVVTTVCGTAVFANICKKYNLVLHETPVGFKYICDIMRKEDVLIGGEEAGGIGFKDYIPERDGILSGLLLLEMMASRKKGIIEILNDMEKEFGEYHYHKTSAKIDQAKKDSLMANIEKNPPKEVLGKKVVGLNDKDGLKFMCEDSSWLLFRLSGTEPILRIYAEASTEEISKNMLEFGKEFASKL